MSKFNSPGASADCPDTGSDAERGQSKHSRHPLERAFRDERPQLLAYVGRRAGYDVAADLVQEVFAKAAGSRQASTLVNPAAFVRRIARNLLIDRSRRTRDLHTVPFGQADEAEFAVAPQQAWNLEAEDLYRLYEEALSRLPDKTRMVFLMHRVEELSYREIHERLGISVATVEYHMMRALARIAAVVDEADERE